MGMLGAAAARGGRGGASPNRGPAGRGASPNRAGGAMQQAFNIKKPNNTAMT